MDIWVGGRTARLECFDATARRSLAMIDIGHAVSALAVNGATVAAVGGGRRGRMTLVSTATRSISDTHAGLRFPCGVASTSKGPVVLCGGRRPKLVRPGDGAVWAAGSHAHDVASGFGSLWVLRQSRPPRLLRLEPSSGTVQARIEVHGDPQAFSCGESAVWVATDAPGAIDRVDPQTMTVTHTVEVDRQPTSAVEALGRVWVTHGHLPLLTVIDAAAPEVVSTMRVGAPSFGIAAADGLLWLVQTLADRVAVVDPERLGVLDRIDMDQPMAVVAAAP